MQCVMCQSSMGEYSSKKFLSCYAGFFKKSYFAEEQKHRFLGKFAKLLDKNGFSNIVNIST